MDIRQLTINNIRTLAADTVQKANSGHPGAPMGMAPMAYAVWMQQMRHNPKDPQWKNRDRFVLSKGHCVETLYAVLAERGFMDINEVKAQFSKFGSEYIGHPHNTLPGIEMNSGSLGHGLSVSVGMALPYVAVTLAVWSVLVAPLPSSVTA